MFLFVLAPWVSALPPGLELLLVLGLTSVAAMTLFWLTAIAFWHASERPSGLEWIILQRMEAAGNGFSG